ncbi:hypothetical protein PY365_28635 [Roseiarcaceae bacterium H3SJ34-1]|uniref:hypothetical protein n=1 Tax=Terripilifer ovatus TaxID=3032367 RepID=UPI003AB99504|nr:hypothetical protein [Roseiarcaceae bacterium H3SJ34-1]
MPTPTREPDEAGQDAANTSTPAADAATWSSTLLEPGTIGMVVVALVLIAGLAYYFAR